MDFVSITSELPKTSYGFSKRYTDQITHVKAAQVAFCLSHLLWFQKLPSSSHRTDGSTECLSSRHSDRNVSISVCSNSQHGSETLRRLHHQLLMAGIYLPLVFTGLEGVLKDRALDAHQEWMEGSKNWGSMTATVLGLE